MAAAAVLPQVTALCPGRVVALQSSANGHFLQVTDEKTMAVNGKATHANASSYWTVHIVDWNVKDQHHPVIRLESVKVPGKFLRISADKQLDAGGHSQGEYTEMTIVGHGDGCVSFFSRAYYEKYAKGSTYYVAVNPDGDAKDPTKTTNMHHSRFKPVFAPAQEFRNGRVLALQSMATGGAGQCLSVTAGDDLKGQNDAGGAAQFKVTVVNDGLSHSPTIQLESCAVAGKFLRIDLEKKLNAGGHSQGEFTFFTVVSHDDGCISLRSRAYNIKEEAQYHVGMLPDGSKKAPTETGTGPHGRFRVVWIS